MNTLIKKAENPRDFTPQCEKNNWLVEQLFRSHTPVLLFIWQRDLQLLQSARPEEAATKP